MMYTRGNNNPGPSMRDQTNQVVDAVVKASPPAAVAFYDRILGMPVADWLSYALVVYTVLQIVFLLYDRMNGKHRRTDKRK